MLDVLDSLLPWGVRAHQTAVVGEYYSAVVIDDGIEGREDLLAIHPVKRAAHDDEQEAPEVARKVRRVALCPSHVGDPSGSRGFGGLGEHLRLGVHADCFSDVRGQRDGQLAGAAAHVEKSPGAIEVEPGNEVGKERLRIAGPVSRVVPGSSCEQGAAGAAE